VNGRAIARDWFLDMLDQETARRRYAARRAAGGDPRASLLKMLDGMSARLRANPGFVEPSGPAAPQLGQSRKKWFRRRGYTGS
jgi:hypothetical protein